MRLTKTATLMDTSQNGSIKKLEYHSNTMNTLENYAVELLFLCDIDVFDAFSDSIKIC